MAVIIKYHVEVDGEEKLVTLDKKEADSFDKQLATAASLMPILASQNSQMNEDQLHALSLYMAQNSDLLVDCLKGPKKSTTANSVVKKAKKAPEKNNKQPTLDLTNLNTQEVVEEVEDKISQREINTTNVFNDPDVDEVASDESFDDFVIEAVDDVA